MISIIIPVYNSEKFLNRCIDSILSQTYSDFEIILVDDGSSDSSGDICDGYARADKRIKAFHKSNGGVSSARNFGLGKANGEWVTFIDADDYVSQFLLEDYVSRMHNNSDLYIQGFIDVTGGNQSKMFEEDMFVYEDCFKETEKVRNNIVYSYVFNKLFNINIVRRYGISFETNISMLEDTLFVFHYLKHIYSICHVPTANYYYETNDNSASKKNHPASSWCKWFEVSSALYSPYVCKEQVFAYRGLKHIWNSMLDALNDKYVRKSSFEERTEMIRVLKKSEFKPVGIYRFSKKGILSIFIKSMPIIVADKALLIVNTLKCCTRSN